MAVDQLTQWDAHLLLDRDWIVHVAADAEKLRPRILITPEAVKPARTSAHDRWAYRDRLNVRHSSRTPI